MPAIRALLGTASRFCEVVVLKPYPQQDAAEPWGQWVLPRGGVSARGGLASKDWTFFNGVIILQAHGSLRAVGASVLFFGSRGLRHLFTAPRIYVGFNYLSQTQTPSGLQKAVGAMGPYTGGVLCTGGGRFMGLSMGGLCTGGWVR